MDHTYFAGENTSFIFQSKQPVGQLAKVCNLIGYIMVYYISLLI
jgi:hypothetical protein